MRLDHLVYFKVVPPLAMFKNCGVASAFYKEAVQAYLLGMPNSSVIMSLKTLELGLRCKFKDRKAKLVELIERLKGEGGYRDLAHGFRILRNLVVHENIECREQDALEALRYVSEVLNKAFPYSSVRYTMTCSNSVCKAEYPIELSVDEYFLGNIVRVKCPKCGIINTLIVGTEWGLPHIC